MPTILQVSDTHLSPRNGLFLDNIAALRRFALQARPDLTVFSGDLTLDGADREEDMRFAADQLHAFPGPLLFLPGNHDIGSHPCSMPHQVVDEVRLERFRRHFGPGRGAVDLPGWRVIGLDTEVMDTGVGEEADQAAFVVEAVAGLAGRRIALFLHKPLALDDQTTTMADPWTVPPAARPSLAPVLAHPALRLVASGHLHMFRCRMAGKVAHLGSPAASFIMNPEDQDGIEGDRRCGALLHRLGADTVETEIVTMGVESIHLDTVRHLIQASLG